MNVSLEIRLDRLEEECQNNPTMTRDVGVEKAQASKRVKECKNRLKLRKAKLDQEVRSNPKAYGLEKVTEAAIESIVTLDTEYGEESKELIDLEFAEDVLDATFRAMVDKKSELENLTHLHGQMYWSKPQTGSREADRTAAMEGANAAVGKKAKK